VSDHRETLDTKRLHQVDLVAGHLALCEALAIRSTHWSGARSIAAQIWRDHGVFISEFWDDQSPAVVRLWEAVE
jgi:hypothetical protein